MKKMSRAFIILMLLLLSSFELQAGPACQVLWPNVPVAQQVLEAQRPPETKSNKPVEGLKKLAVKLEASEGNLSRQERDNAHHFWAFSKAKAAEYFGPLMSYVGKVLGDGHAGNMPPTFVSHEVGDKRRGKETLMPAFFTDIKDVSRAPFVVDFARLVLIGHSYLKGKELVDQTAKRKVVTGLLLDAYAHGVAGDRMPVPASMQPSLRMSPVEYRAQVNEYVLNTTKLKADETGAQVRRFKFKEGKVEKIVFEGSNPGRLKKLQNDMAASVKLADPEAIVLDYGKRPRERGGSVEQQRYWVLTKSISKEGAENFQIYEFKEIGEPAASQYVGGNAHETPQQAVNRIQDVMDTMWSVKDPTYRTLILDGLPFMMRPKKVDILGVPYGSNKPQQVQLALDMTAFVAHFMGQLHGNQMTAQQRAAYSKALSPENEGGHRDSWVDNFTVFAKNYERQLLHDLGLD